MYFLGDAFSEDNTKVTNVFKDAVWFWSEPYSHLLLFSCSVLPDSLQPHGLQHARLPYPSPSHGACSNSCPLSQWCHSTILSSVVPFSFCLQFFPASGSFPMSPLVSGGQSIGASASVLPVNIQDWFPLGLTVSDSLWPSWTVAHQAPLSMEFSCQEYWSG